MMEYKSIVEETLTKLSRLIKTVNTLTTPSASGITLSETKSESEQSPALIDKVLEENLVAVSIDIEKSPELQGDVGELLGMLRPETRLQSFISRREITVREKHVEVCVFLLHEVCACLKVLSSLPVNNDKGRESGAPKLDPDSLSAAQIKSVSLALQFVVVLGICPYLTPGVGISVSQRMGPAQILLATIHDYGSELSHLERVQRLLPPAKLMCDMLSVMSLRDIVINSHLHDLLSVLFQLRFSTKSVQDQELSTDAQTKGGVSKSDAKLTKCSHQAAAFTEGSSDGRQEEGCFVYGEQPLPTVYSWSLPEVRGHCNQFIDKAVRLSSTPHVLKTLLMLSGGGKSGGVSGVSAPVKTPVWFRRTVAGLLRDVIMVAPGVQHLILLLVADSRSGCEWQQCKAVAQVIAQLPTTSTNFETFHRSVTSQLLAMLGASTGASSAAPVTRAVGSTILELTNRSPGLMKSVCFTPLFEPLLKMSSHNDISALPEGNMVVSESALTACVDCLYKLYVLGQEPLSPLLSELRRSVRVLFGMLSACWGTVSSLRSKCVALLGAYLGYCEAAECVRFVLDLVTSSREWENPISSPDIHRDVCVSLGPSGGMQAVKLTGARAEEESVAAWTRPVDVVMEILNNVKTETVVPQLFIR
ncbi:hypothetical protein EGW08_004141, partial [Elysia chlorotica]